MKFNAYTKRVTLNMALHSVAARERGNGLLIPALEAARDADWDLRKLNQEMVELIYSEMDATFEAEVQSEFEADPNFLIDLGASMGVCPLCGHSPIRWLFQVQNTKGGGSIQCGSECIIQYGIAVMGAETAEHARKILAEKIRKAMRALEIKTWHEETGFEEMWLRALDASLARINRGNEGYRTTRSAWYKRIKDLPKLVRFYERNGWLNTRKRWDEWARLVNFARGFDTQIRSDIPRPGPWQSKAEKTLAAQKALAVNVPVAEIAGCETGPECLGCKAPSSGKLACQGKLMLKQALKSQTITVPEGAELVVTPEPAPHGGTHVPGVGLCDPKPVTKPAPAPAGKYLDLANSLVFTK